MISNCKTYQINKGKIFDLLCLQAVNLTPKNGPPVFGNSLFNRCRQVRKLIVFTTKIICCFSSTQRQKSLFFASCEEKYCYPVVSVGQLGLTAVRTAGTAIVVLNKSLFRSFFLVLSWEV